MIYCFTTVNFTQGKVAARRNAGAVDWELSVLCGPQSLTEWPRFRSICANIAGEKCNALDLFTGWWFVLVTIWLIVSFWKLLAPQRSFIVSGGELSLTLMPV